MPELKVSAPGDIQRRGEKVIELPEPQADGSKIVIRIAQKYLSDLWAEGGELKALAEVPAGSKGRKVVGPEAEKMIEEIAAAGIIEPQFCFGERVEGYAYWPDLSFGNRMFVVQQIMELGGISIANVEASGKEGAAARLATFPGIGAPGLDGGVRTRKAGPAAKRADPRGRGARRRQEARSSRARADSDARGTTASAGG